MDLQTDWKWLVSERDRWNTGLYCSFFFLLRKRVSKLSVQITMTNSCMLFAWLAKAFADFRKFICLWKWRLQCSNRALTLQLSRCLMELNSCTSLKRVTIVHCTLWSWKQELTAANPRGSSHSLLVSTLQLRKWCYWAFFSGLLSPMVTHLYGQTFSPTVTVLKLGAL